MIELNRKRHSTRDPFALERSVSREELLTIIEAACWAPTAHTMQSFEIIVLDDRVVIEVVSRIESTISEAFIRESFAQLCLSEEELRRKKVGILGTRFAPKWTDVSALDEAIASRKPAPLAGTIRGGNTLPLVLYDTRKRAPASAGDLLGHLSLGCVLEKIWLMAEALGKSVRLMSGFGADAVRSALREMLDIPEHLALGFARKQGYPARPPASYRRVRREVESFTHHNRYGNRGLP